MSIFHETMKLIEKLSEITFFVMVKVTPITACLLRCAYTFFIYFTTDAGNAAFELPFPMW